MPDHTFVEPGAEWTPEPVPCGFCGKPDEGYAKKDKDGKWKPSCWACIKPKNPPPPPKMKMKPIIEEEPPVEEKKDGDNTKPDRPDSKVGARTKSDRQSKGKKGKKEHKTPK